MKLNKSRTLDFKTAASRWFFQPFGTMRNSIVLGFLFTSICLADETFSKFPEVIDPNGKYVFYSHGLIVEGDNPTPESPRFGIYDFPQVKMALSDDSYNLIAYHRPKDTDPASFAKKLSGDVLELVSKGVEPQNISLVGFSRGGVITVYTSNLLARDDISYVILAGCGDFFDEDPGLNMYGSVFSVIETTDDIVGSCESLINRSTAVKRFNELSISTGKEHGAFYRPIPEWINPVKKWIKRNHTEQE